MFEEPNKDEDLTPSETEETTAYKQQLDYEGVLNKQINRICFYRADNIGMYIRSIDALIMVLMEDIRHQVYVKKKELKITEMLEGSYGVPPNVIIAYDTLFIYINKLLEDNNLIFKKGGFQKGKF